MEAVLALMGLKADGVSGSDSLAGLGVDSMQLLEVRTLLQKRLCRGVALESIGAMTIASLRALAGPCQAQACEDQVG